MIESNKTIETYITTKEFAQIIRYKPNTLAKWRITHQEKIPYIKTGGRILYPLSSVMEWIESKGTNG